MDSNKTNNKALEEFRKLVNKNINNKLPPSITALKYTKK